MLVGKNISLRNLNKSDLHFLEKIENDSSLWKFGSERKKFTTQELLSYISNSNISIFEAKQYRFVIDYNGFPIGFVDLFDYSNNEASVGIIIDDKYQSRGFAKEALSILSIHCFNHLDIIQLNSCVDVMNHKSNKLFVSSGYKFVRKDNNHNFYIFVR